MKKLMKRLGMAAGLLILLSLLRFPLESLEQQYSKPQKLELSFPLPENVLINYQLDHAASLRLEIEKVVVAGYFSTWDTDNEKYIMTQTGPHSWEYYMEDFDPGDNAYKYVIFIKGWPQPLWTHDARKKTTDDSFGGYNSVYTIPNIQALRTLVNLLLGGAVILLLLYTLLEPLIRWIMVLRLPLRIKLTLSMLLVPLITNLTFVLYNLYELREITKQGLIDTMNLLHLNLEGAGIDFEQIESFANQPLFQNTLSRSFQNARVRIEKNKLANIQLSLSDFFIADKNLNFVYSQSRDEVLEIETASMRRMGYALRREYLQKEFLDYLKIRGKDWSSEPRRYFMYLPPRMMNEYSSKYQSLINWIGYNVIMVPVLQRNEVQAWYFGVIEVEMLANEIRRVMFFNLLLLGAIALLMILVYLNMGGILTTHLEQLTEWTRYIIKGNFAIEKKIITHDEIEDLAVNFDAMRLSLGQNMNSLKLLNLVTANLHHVTNVDDLFNVFLTFITANFGFQYNRAVIFLLEKGRLQGKYAIGQLDETELIESFGSRSNYTSLKLDVMEFMSHYRGDMKPREGKLLQAVRSIEIHQQDRSVLWDVVKREAVFYAPDKDMFFHLKDRQLQSLLDLSECAFLPLYKGDTVIGVLLVDNYFKKKPIREADINQLQIIINDFSANLANSYIIQNLEAMVQERTSELKQTYSDLKTKDLIMSTDLSIAQKIQKSLLVYQPETMKGIQTEIIYDPMGEVGGDLYDIFLYRENKVRVLLADATGHGVQAALITMLIKSEYEKIKRQESNPARILDRLNQGFISNYPYLSFFFTCIVVDVDLRKGRLTWSSGGHPAQMLLRQSGVRYLPSTGKILGLEAESVYTNRSHAFHRGDQLLLFTDGIFEQFNTSNQEFGDERLHQLVTSHNGLSLPDLLKTVMDAVHAFNDTGFSNDDITLIGIEKQSEP